VTGNDARPQTLGDLLDRTFALPGRFWLRLFAVLAPAALGVALLQLAAEPALTHFFATLNRLIALPPGAAAERARVAAELTHAIAPSGWVTAYFLGQLALFPLAQTAAFAFVEGTLAGRPPAIAAAYRAALPRLPAQIAVLIAFVLMSWLLAVPFGLIAIAGIVSTYALAPLSHSAGGVLAVLFFGAFGAAVVLAVSAGYFAWLMASASVATEDAGPRRAIERGLRRVLDPALRRRTVTVAPVLIGVNWLALLTIDSLGSVVAGAVHVDALFVLIPALAGVGIDGVRVAFVQIYVDDVRLRREGTDLLAASAALPGAAAEDADEDGLGSAERALIDAFLARRATLEPAASAEIAARIAAHVRPRLRASFHYLDDAALLEHVSRSRG
jgi:hypothetical protein